MAAVEAIEQRHRLPRRRARDLAGCRAAHVAERTAHHYLPIVFGMTITSCPDPRQIVAYLPEVRPTWFFAVPRDLGEAQGRPRGDARRKATSERKPLQWLEAGDREGRARAGAASRCPTSSPPTRRGGRRAAVRRAARDARPRPGRARSTSAPRRRRARCSSSSTPSASRWPSCGACRETCGAGAQPARSGSRSARSGPPAPGVELKLGRGRRAARARSDVVMMGYRNLPDKTAEALDDDGWLHTGDIGEIDDDGYVTIVDRKKELIINAAGKNMSPANIEATLKGASPLIGQACVIGDGAPLQHGADRARRRLRAGVGGPAGHRGRRRWRRWRATSGARGGPGGRRRGQRASSRASSRSRSSRSSRATGCPAATS